MPYLDYNGSAPLRDTAKTAMLEAMEQLGEGGNPSSPHRYGRRARKLLEDARRTIAEGLDFDPRRLIFTSGATEANHLALAGSGAKAVVASAVEHVSVSANGGPRLLIAEADGNGLVDVSKLRTTLATAPSPFVLAVMSANNEVGTLTPNLPELAQMAHERGGLFHCDITQSVGKAALPEPVADTATISAHKFGGPVGIGALFCRNRNLKAQIGGGGQEWGLRSGVQNVVAACGFAAALPEALKEPRNPDLRDYFETELVKLEPEVIIFARERQRLVNTSCFALPGLSSETMVISLDLAGFAVGSGGACSSGKMEGSNVIRAMGFSDEVASSAVRVSTGFKTAKSDIRGLLGAIADVIMTAGKNRQRDSKRDKVVRLAREDPEYAGGYKQQPKEKAQMEKNRQVESRGL